MPALHNPKQNHLLATLPAAEFQRLSPHLELTPMPLGEVYYEAAGKLRHVYFPTTSIVSLHYVTMSGAAAEIAGVGNEGMFGASLLMGGKAKSSRAFVRAAGYGYRIKAPLLMEEFNRAGPMQRLLRRYIRALVTQTSQTAICNQRHPVDQRLCRWLLLTIDRLPSQELTLTQDLLASMFGVSPDDAMKAVWNLQQAELIRYRRGRITVLDRHGLEGHACECYRVVKMELDHLLGLDPDWRPMPECVESA